MKCDHCPEPGPCRGESIPRLCVLVKTRVDYVPTLTRAGNALKAAARYAADGFKNADAATRTRRLEICEGCPRNRGGVCQHPDCGCFVTVKTLLASQSCPEGKWPAAAPTHTPCEGCPK